MEQKGNNASRMMILSLIGVGTLVSGIGGVKLINDAYAIPGTNHQVNGPGTINMLEFFNSYDNVGATDVTVLGMSVNPPFICNGSCSVNTVVEPGNSCDITCLDVE